MAYDPNDPATAALLRRLFGRDRTGTVSVRDFDQGVVETMGATVQKDQAGNVGYYLNVPGVDPAPGKPGTQVIFANPEDVLAKYVLPYVVVRRDDIAPAMQRWHPGSQQYRVPANGALPVTIPGSGADPGFPSAIARSGFNRVETLPQAVPFDLMYTISIHTRERGAPVRTDLELTLLKAVMSVYQPYCVVFVPDSIGDLRDYEAFGESYSLISDIEGPTARKLGRAIGLRVEGELDLNDPHVTPTALSVVRRSHRL